MSSVLPNSKAEPAAGCCDIRWQTLILPLVLAVSGCAIDLASKHLVFAWLGLPGESAIFWVVRDLVGIETSLNQGALFGLGQGKVAMFAAFSFVAIAGIGYWLTVGKASQDRFLAIILGTVLGGILGNLYDRMGLWSYGMEPRVYAVRDWIRLSWGEHVWPNFNIADSLLVVGAGCLVVYSYLSEARSPKSNRDAVSE